MGRLPLTLLVAALVTLAGCGEETRAPEPAPTPGAASTRLEVVVRPQGADGPERRRVVTEVPRGIRPADFAPVPAGVACSQIYGGPATARVTGTLAGERIEARFERTDGCQIARWDRLSALLGEQPDPATP